MQLQASVRRWSLSMPLGAGRLRLHWLDAALALVIAALTTSAISMGREPGAQEPDALAYVLGVAIGVPFLFRRASALGVLLVVMGLSLLYHGLNYPGGPPQPAVWTALFLAALAGERNIALALGVAGSVGGVSYRAIVEGDSLLDISMIAEVVLAFGSVMAGDALHARRKWMAEVRERLERAEHEREEEARHRVEQERLRIAHELHDVLAHTLSVVNVQAGVASDLLEHDAAATRAALDAMRQASREAMHELRATVGVLRDDRLAPRGPAPGLRDLDRILDSARQAGLAVTKVVEGRPRPLSAPVDLAAFRVSQEAVTNVVRHATARSARIVLGYEPGGLALEVADDGRGAAVVPSLGYGIIGMRERVEALGGRFETLTAPGRGFVVRAWLPDPAA